jgi:hypothetical protein
MKKTSQSIDGTSFHNVVVKCSLSTLTKVLGNPDCSGNDGENKINFEWEMETNDGDVFTVYDWKEYRSLNENELIEWHIGGTSRSITEQAAREIRDAIAKI